MTTDEIRHFRRLARRFGQILGALHGQAICCAGLTVPQAHALLEIEDRRETTVMELAGALRLAKGTVSKTVDSLVELGYVKRTTRASDRRYRALTLTPTGRAAAARVHVFGDDVARRTFEKIPPERRLATLECFEALVEASWEADGEQGKRQEEDRERSDCVREMTQE